MRVRVFELRLLALALTVGWTVACGAILLAYRPGGPLDLVVGLAAGLPVVVALAGLAWPPVARSDRVFALTVWLGLGALVVLVPAILEVVSQLRARGTQTLMPSPEAAYPWILALLGTAIYSGFGVARRLLGGHARRRDRLARGLILGLSASVVIGSVFAGVAIANEVALRDVVVASSRFGPTDPNVEPPECSEAPTVGPAARVELVLTGNVDGGSLGTVDVRGVRSGDDFRWLAYVATNQELGQYGEARIGELAWTRRPAGTWQLVPHGALDARSLDAAALQVLLDPAGLEATEVHGVSVFEGARARHCRLAIDGAAFRAAFPQVRWLVGGADLGRWRGELDYWVFTDGQLGRLTGSVSGEGSLLVEGGLQATLTVAMTATERSRSFDIPRPTS